MEAIATIESRLAELRQGMIEAALRGMSFEHEFIEEPEYRFAQEEHGEFLTESLDRYGREEEGWYWRVKEEHAWHGPFDTEGLAIENAQEMAAEWLGIDN